MSLNIHAVKRQMRPDVRAWYFLSILGPIAPDRYLLAGADDILGNNGRFSGPAQAVRSAAGPARSRQENGELN